jgi:hypothetical protein
MWVPVRRVKAPNGFNVAQDLKLGELQPAVGVLNNPETSSIVRLGSVQRKAVNRERDSNDVKLQETRSDQFDKEANSEFNMQERSDKALAVSSRNGQNFESAGLVMENCCLGASRNVCPLEFKSSIVTSARGRECKSNRGSRRRKSGNTSVQQSVFSAKEKISAPRTALCQYMPRNLGGNMIKSVIPGTKPRPPWCPTGLTRTQKQRVQRLRMLKIQEEIAEKKRNKWFNRDRPMVCMKIWRDKHIAVEEKKDADDIVADGNSENKNDEPSDDKVADVGVVLGR